MLLTQMRAMFQGCNGLINLDMTSFNIKNVTDIRYMFNSCHNLKK